MLGPESNSEFQVFPDNAELTHSAADYFLHHASRAIQTGGQVTIALAGGSTPKALYSLLATPPYQEQLDWGKVHMFWGDERHVPPDHQESNFRMAQHAMLSRLPIPATQIHRMEGDRSDAQEAADAYESLLQKHFKLAPPHIPKFDLIFLGLGPDGHTASLFPGTTAVHEHERWIAAPWVEKFHTYRITMTPVLLNQASHIAFLVSGQDKSTALHAVLEGPYQPDKFPAQVIRPVHGKITWFLDKAAAHNLHTRS